MTKRIRKESLVRQIQVTLDAKLNIGESKHADKRKEKELDLRYGEITEKYIYSWGSYKSVMKHCNYFAKYCKENHGCKTLEQCRPYVNEWLTYQLYEKNNSVNTIKTYRSDLAKLYGCRSEDFAFDIDDRYRGAIKRSRGPAVRDKGFSLKKNHDLIEFCKSTGLRDGELRFLLGSSYYEDENGNPFLHVWRNTKGGNIREVPIIHNPALVKKYCEAAGDGLVFKHVHTKADIHSFRADYAAKLYTMIARDPEDIPYDKVNPKTKRRYKSEVYYCRKDKKGTTLDRVAMKKVSEALGHYRVNVISGHYLHGLDEIAKLLIEALPEE